MKKILLIPSLLTVGLMPMVSITACNNPSDPGETEYDLTIIDSEHITVSPTKFKLNQDLVIYYSCDDGYVIDAEGSAITIGDNVYTVSQLPYDGSTVTLSKDKVNYETITVNFLATQTPGPQPTDPTSITLNETTLSLNKDETFELKATVWPEGATCSLEWTSSDNSVATVNNGVVTTHDFGSAKITVKAVGFENVKAVCNVFIVDPDYYLTITALEPSTFRTFGKNQYGDITLKYQAEGYTGWSHFDMDLGFSSEVVPIPSGSTLKLRGDNNLGQPLGFLGVHLLFTGKVILSGNIMSLMDETMSTTDIPCSQCFDSLFSVGTSSIFNDYHNSIVSAEELILPDTDLTGADYCYEMMFQGCQALERGPRLKATTLSSDCYKRMFYGCISLNEIKLDYTGNFTEDYFDWWVNGVPTTGGTFYYNGSDTENFGDSAIPGIDSDTHWTVQTFE